MADKYIIHGAAYCGDGTSSAEASSDGGVGAWNNINILMGTTPPYGTLAAGDTVYIRSKTSAGANITVFPTASFNMGSASATKNAMINWVVDGGAVWAGVNGVITFNFAATSYTCTLQPYNHLYCSTQDSVVFTWSGATSAVGILRISGGAIASRFCVDGTSATTFGRSVTGLTGPIASEARAVSPHAKLNRYFGYNVGLFNAENYARFVVDNPLIEINDTSAVPVNPLFFAGAYNACVEVNGGNLKGAYVSTGFKVAAANTIGAGGVTLNGFKYPNVFSSIAFGQTFPSTSSNAKFESFNADGSAGSEAVNSAGEYSSRADNNPPTLNATLPNSVNKPWSWKAYPSRACQATPLVLKAAKMITTVASAPNLIFEFLLATTMSATSADIWVDVTYTDNATGDPVFVTSKPAIGAAAGPLEESTAAWSATTWGAISFAKKKITLSLPSSVKQDTVIEASFMIGVLSNTANDILFVCPDFQIA